MDYIQQHERCTGERWLAKIANVTEAEAEAETMNGIAFTRRNYINMEHDIVDDKFYYFFSLTIYSQQIAACG